MKRILLAGTFALAAVGQALAADLPQAPPPMPPQAPAAYIPAPLPVYDWAGVYIGINGGYGFGSTEWSPAGGVATGNFNVNGGLVGGTLGANFQTGPWVFGIEADADWADLKGTVTNTTTCGFGTSCTFQTSSDWLGTVRGRVGYAFDRVLLYGTAGGAFGNEKATLSSPTFLTTSSSNTEFGWTAGAGIEVGITPYLTAKVEYLFVDLANGSFSCTAATCGTTLSVPVTFDASIVRAGLNFKFNPF
jgi:outer membrane immunogenic protein